MHLANLRTTFAAARVWFFAAALLCAGNAQAQIITTVPAFPTENDSITVTYDAAQGSKGLMGLTTPIYAHTGVVTNLSASNSDWKHVIAAWTTNLPKATMTSLGNDKYSIKIAPSVRSWYGVTAGNETAQQLAFVFRNADGSKEGKTAAGGDIFVPLYSASSPLLTIFQTPTTDYGVYSTGANVPLLALASKAANVAFYLDGTQIATGTNVTSLSYSLTATTGGNHTVLFVANTATNTDTSRYHFTVTQNLTAADPPAGTQTGINDIGGGNVILKLYAPSKQSAFVVGSFTNWQPDAAYQMRKTLDGNSFWIQLALTAGQKYTYQYLVDGIRVADPLSETVLNQYDDPYITSSSYPQLPPFPTGKATGNVTLLEPAATPYTWTTPNFVKPAKTDLVVYELLVRDFFNTNENFNHLRDSLDYLARLGVNCIELMPVSEFEGNLSWGYNTSFHNALDKYYGSRNMFKAFIDAAHARGIAVVMDIAFNDAFGQNPDVQLWWDAANNQPAANNPFFNAVPKHPYNVGYDYNHESPATHDYVDRVLHHWIQDFKIDGFRFDLAKGYTQTNSGSDVGLWGQYDASRIVNLKRIADVMWAADPNAYVILEEFADNSEETVLANYGMMLWSAGSNHDYNEGSMGYTTDLSYASSYKARNWTKPGLMSFMEDHDEERLMYKNLQYGNVNATTGYSVKTLATALKRQELVAAFFFTVPGPKMIYEFGETGFDLSIYTCQNGTVSTTGGCRTDQKPAHWEYYTDPNRKHLFDVYRALINLKTTQSVFKTTNFVTDLSGLIKRTKLYGGAMDAVVVGNFAVSDAANATIGFTKTGKWYEYFSGDSLTVTDVNMTLPMTAGAYRIYTSRNLRTTADFTIPAAGAFGLEAFPNPANGTTTLLYHLDTRSTVALEVFDILGRNIATLATDTEAAGEQTTTWNAENVPAGTYFVRLTANGAVQTRKITIVK